MKTTSHVAGNDSDQHMRRVVIVGVSGSGKSILAQRLAAALGCDYVELDALYWGPGWSPRPLAVIRDSLSKGIAAQTWVVDGNYGELRDITWGRADTLVWLGWTIV